MLTKILSSADERALVAATKLEEFRARAEAMPPPRDFLAALRGPGLSVIAEIKRRSPSAGDIDMEIRPDDRAASYVAGGADAISVLTEPYFFAGSLDDLAAVRTAVDVPVLRKDFTRNGAQIWEARASGADAVLLIVAALGDGQIEELLGVAGEAGMSAIVEAHTLDEVGRALALDAPIVGVNNRDLHTFVTDLSVAENAAPLIPDHVVSIGESGVSDPAGAARMANAGYDAILVGEALVRADDPRTLVAALKAAR